MDAWIADAEKGSFLQLQCSFPPDHFERHPHFYALTALTKNSFHRGLRILAGNMQSIAAMAHTSAFSGHYLQPPPQRLQVQQQLTSLRFPLLVQQQSGRCLQRAALVSDVAVPMPPAQPESPARRLRRTSSEGLDRAVQLLRSLSSKFTSAPEGIVQQVRRRLRKALLQSFIFKAAVAPVERIHFYIQEGSYGIPWAIATILHNVLKLH